MDYAFEFLGDVFNIDAGYEMVTQHSTIHSRPMEKSNAADEIQETFNGLCPHLPLTKWKSVTNTFSPMSNPHHHNKEACLTVTRVTDTVIQRIEALLSTNRQQ